jgi:hypothetical protein
MPNDDFFNYRSEEEVDPELEGELPEEEEVEGDGGNYF